MWSHGRRVVIVTPRPAPPITFAPVPSRPLQARPDEPELAEDFRKDPADEEFIGALNAALSGFEAESLRDLPERLPTLHVIGAPRSGTTLLFQVLASGLDIAYVSNLAAAFWRAPVTGMRLARKLGVDRLEASSFDSAFGRTAGVAEPHEFGYFWNHHLGYPDLRERPASHEETIDWDHLRRVMINMAERAGRPIAFKPMLLLWHLERMASAMPRTCFVWIRREPRLTALSLLKMRRGLRGSVDEWASLRPAEPLDDEPPWRQVAAQVVLLERTIARAATALGPERVLRVDYAELCADPASVLGRVADLMERHGHRPALRPGVPDGFAPQSNAALEDEFGERVDEALDHFTRRFGEGGGTRG